MVSLCPNLWFWNMVLMSIDSDLVFKGDDFSRRHMSLWNWVCDIFIYFFMNVLNLVFYLFFYVFFHFKFLFTLLFLRYLVEELRFFIFFLFILWRFWLIFTRLTWSSDWTVFIPFNIELYRWRWLFYFLNFIKFIWYDWFFTFYCTVFLLLPLVTFIHFWRTCKFALKILLRYRKPTFVDHTRCITHWTYSDVNCFLSWCCI